MWEGVGFGIDASIFVCSTAALSAIATAVQSPLMGKASEGLHLFVNLTLKAWIDFVARLSYEGDCHVAYIAEDATSYGAIVDSLHLLP